MFRVRSLRTKILVLSIFALALFAENAAAASAQLSNKTVRYSYTASAQAKRSDGATVTANRNGQLTLYVSSQGRVFERSDRQEYNNRGSNDRAPDKATFRISGNQLVGVAQHVSGATRVTITFDPDFRTCSVNFLMGTDNGKPIQGKGINGMTYTTLEKPKFSNMTCSVTEGNAFGG